MPTIVPMDDSKDWIYSPIFETIYKSLALFDNTGKPPSLFELNQHLNLESIRFVEQSVSTSDFASWYEPRIYLKGEVQTREDSWHDYFNALVWANFTSSKRVINRLQYEAQKSHYPSKQRLPVENMLALFDENGSLIISKDPILLDLIREYQWHELFWVRREEFGKNIKVHAFGHGLLEKALHPYVGLTSQALLFHADEVESVDELTASFIAKKAHALTTSDLSPFPILGVPGWWPDNRWESFYRNEAYFRKKRLR